MSSENKRVAEGGDGNDQDGKRSNQEVPSDGLVAEGTRWPRSRGECDGNEQGGLVARWPRSRGECDGNEQGGLVAEGSVMGMSKVAS
eukprot:scaffold62734_cov38-Attheya_sp.AAC.2